VEPPPRRAPGLAGDSGKCPPVPFASAGSVSMRLTGSRRRADLVQWQFGNGARRETLLRALARESTRPSSLVAEAVRRGRQRGDCAVDGRAEV
jgi:hypothetical protein